MVLWTVAVGPVISGSAEGIDATLLKQTGILTLPTDAGLVVRTFKVTLAASYKWKKLIETSVSKNKASGHVLRSVQIL